MYLAGLDVRAPKWRMLCLITIRPGRRPTYFVNRFPSVAGASIPSALLVNLTVCVCPGMRVRFPRQIQHLELHFAARRGLEPAGARRTRRSGVREQTLVQG